MANSYLSIQKLKRPVPGLPLHEGTYAHVSHPLSDFFVVAFMCFLMAYRKCITSQLSTDPRMRSPSQAIDCPEFSESVGTLAPSDFRLTGVFLSLPRVLFNSIYAFGILEPVAGSNFNTGCILLSLKRSDEVDRSQVEGGRDPFLLYNFHTRALLPAPGILQGYLHCSFIGTDSFRGFPLVSTFQMDASEFSSHLCGASVAELRAVDVMLNIESPVRPVREMILTMVIFRLWFPRLFRSL